MIHTLQNWWRAISAREQRLLIAGGFLLLVSLFYWGLWQPLNSRIAKQDLQVQYQRQTLAWLKEKGEQVIAIQRKTTDPIGSSTRLEGVINRTAFNHQINISRLQPQEHGVQVWIDTVPFDDLLRWLATLHAQHGIAVQSIEIARQERAPGHVKVQRLQLSRPE
ncbi:MAG: type II secretion system protein GspM [Aeromonas sp.]